MAHILVVGGGLSGCAAALELAARGQDVTIIEKTSKIGGKVCEFGCKAGECCNNCGVCITGGMWEAVQNHSSIKVMTNTKLTDVYGDRGDFSAVLDGHRSRFTLSGISAILVAIGFERASDLSFGNLEFEDKSGIITGFELEKMMSARTQDSILQKPCSSIAFIQCFGSRDIKEKAFYCSRVCCAYSTRAAKAIKNSCPEAKITFFHMDMQYIEQGRYYEGMLENGIEFIRSRPIRIKRTTPPTVVFEDPKTGAAVEREFDLIVLSEGIHPPKDAERIAELCMLGTDERGFLKYVADGKKTGVYLAGCASGPKRIEESYSQAVETANRLLSDLVLSKADSVTGEKERLAL